MCTIKMQRAAHLLLICSNRRQHLIQTGVHQLQLIFAGRFMNKIKNTLNSNSLEVKEAVIRVHCSKAD
jgi:hypothetical protein